MSNWETDGIQQSSTVWWTPEPSSSSIIWWSDPNSESSTLESFVDSTSSSEDTQVVPSTTEPPSSTWTPPSSQDTPPSSSVRQTSPPSPSPSPASSRSSTPISSPRVSPSPASSFARQSPQASSSTADVVSSIPLTSAPSASTSSPSSSSLARYTDTTIESLVTSDEETVITTTSGSSTLLATTTNRGMIRTTRVVSQVPVPTDTLALPTGDNPADAATPDSQAIDAGIDSGAKVGIAIGVIAALAAIAVAVHMIAKHFRSKRTANLIRNSLVIGRGFSVRKDDFSWDDLPPAEKGTSNKEKTLSRNMRSPFDEVVAKPIPVLQAKSATRDSTTPFWLKELGLGRPPLTVGASSGKVEQLRSGSPESVQEAVRVSVIAPSSDGGSSAGFMSPQEFQRSPSQNSGNHLHPLFLRQSSGGSGRVMSPSLSHRTSSQSSPSTESHSLVNLARAFPMPNVDAMPSNVSNLLPPTSPFRPFASNNPFRNSVGASSLSSTRMGDGDGDGDFRHSAGAHSVDAGNPFELDFRSEEPDLALTVGSASAAVLVGPGLSTTPQASRRVSILPPSPLRKDKYLSGFSYYDPTTPVTPRPPAGERRGSAVSSVYSMDQPQQAPAWPPLRSPHATSPSHPPAQPQGLAHTHSPAAGRSRTVSQTSNISRQSVRWADEILDVPHVNADRLSSITDVYAGRAL